MLNEEKISLMTKLALYEQKEGKKEIPLSKYYRNDYVSFNILNSAIIGTLVYIMILAAIIIVNAEKLINEITEMDLVAVGKDIIIAYVIMLVIYIAISYVFYSIKFKKIRDSLNQYHGNLKKLYEFYKEESSKENSVEKIMAEDIKPKKTVKKGRTENLDEVMQIIKERGGSKEFDIEEIDVEDN